MSATILVVEDEAIIAMDIRKTLQGLGYTVPPSVSSGKAALEAATAHRPDLVLMDIRIGGDMDGIEAATLIGERHGTPVIYLTSYADEATIARAKGTGPYGYVLKPFEDRDLRTAIEVALHKRQLELQLSERERWFATTLKSIGDAVIATDMSQRITFMNAVAEQLTGWKSSEAAGKSIGEIMRLLDEKTGAPVESPLEHAFREGFAVELPLTRFASKGGVNRTIEDSAAPIIDDAGNTVGGVVVFRDVTERRHLENRLAQSERLAAIGALSAGMAHEINNPLAYVLGNVRLALDELRAVNEKLRELDGPDAHSLALRVAEISHGLGDAREGGERIARIVQDLKKFGRLDDADAAVLELSEVLEGAIRMTENVVRHHAGVRREYGTTPFVEAAESQLSQVFMNLLVNAAQALGEGGAETKEIVVATHTDETGRAVAEVRDSGPGMSPEVLRRVFDPFFTTKAVGEGAGLGLSVAYAIVSSLGGEISVTSRVGEGTTFRVALPPAKQRLSMNRHVEEPIATRRGRVLVIDDEPAIGRVITSILRHHDVFVVTDAREALPRLAVGEVFDVILCDLMMPGMTGMDFFEDLKKSNPEVAKRFVFMTGGVFSARTEEFLRTTTNASIPKPFDPDAMRRIVADYIHRTA